uniref:Uncharacterized protein n=1 Tax=Caenorhabditis japonica TaxID=281687 RepID=A0A8R1EX08_CAEJA
SAGHKNVKNIPMFDKMQEAMDKRNAIEKNIAAVADNFRQSSVIPRISRFTAPPPIKFSKHVEDSNKGLLMAMEEVMNKVRGDPMSWRFRRISHPFFRNSKCLIEVHYCARRPSGEKDFVPHMKAVIVLKYGILEDLMIGGEDEELYDQERILESKRQVYNEFTKSAKEIILCSSVTKFTSSANFTACNNYIQSYVNCFSTKCFYC